MNVAYVFKTDMSTTFQLATMILPQLESETHVAGVCGMFFFDDNIHILSEGNEFGARLSKIAREKGILLMACDQCALRRGYTEGDFSECGSGTLSPKGLVAGATVGCFPQLYEALSGANLDQVITL